MSTPSGLTIVYGTGRVAHSIEPPKYYPEGAGTELSKLLKSMLIFPGKSCGCNAMAQRMNQNPPQWSIDNIDEILDVMAKEAAKRKLPFIRLAAAKLVRIAVRRALDRKGQGTNRSNNER